MNTPNWQHHSKKEQKRKLKPQALRQAKARRNQLLNRLPKTSDHRRGFYSMCINATGL
jgi:plasmid maintenance system killer protein